jgi:carboxyl-terminal processing protease
MVRERDLFRRLKDLKLRVLIDAETHSAAELFASMLQQQGRAVLVGSPSAGVAERISVYNLPGGSRLSVAQAEFYTLNGVPVSKARVRPDVPSDPDWYRAGAQEDPNIRAALRSLD